MAIVLFGCSDTAKKSAFEGDMIKHATAPVGTIPSESIYMLRDTFSTQDNQQVALTHFTGKPTVLGMIFTNCNYACPRLTADIKSIKEKLGENGEDVNYVLVTFDTERDTPAQLKKYAESIDLDKNWTLLHGNEESVRTLSVLLNLQFEKDAEGNFSHSNLISVLDKEGILKFQKEGLEANHEMTITTIKEIINK